MTYNEFYSELNYVDHSRKNRLKYAHMVIAQPELITYLFQIVFEVDDKISCRAAWVLEFMSGEKLESLIPYLNEFTEKLHTLHLDSAVRPMAKICEYLAIACYSKKDEKIVNSFTNLHKDRIIAACFDWMINDCKIAPKAYSMHTLYLLGIEQKWIHLELSQILERDYQGQSSGFKARAKHILKKIASH